MKNLILVRHAKSSWEYDVIDHERPLKTRGINDANLISSNFKNNEFTLDSVLVSDALRTKLTAEIFQKNLEFSPNCCRFEHDLYDFSGEKLTEVIKSCEKSLQNVMIFGHNYAITNFVNTYGDKDFANVPTSGLVWLEFDIDDWQDISKARTKLHLFPKNLK